MDHRELGCERYELESSVSRQGSVEDCCERGNDPVGFKETW
jgi:hypothetical protein